MLDSSDLVKTIQEAAINAVNEAKPSDIFFGTVQTVSPLSVFVEQKLILTEEFLIVPENLTDYKTEISFDDPSIKNQVSVGHRIPDEHAVLITDPDKSPEASKEVILTGELSFQEKVKHKITVYNALKSGEKVILIRQHGGQKYLILDRTERGRK